MKCFICGTNMEKVKTSFKSAWGKYELEIRGVEPFKCPECGYEVFSPEETKMIQDITRGNAESQSTEKPDILTVDEVSDLLKVTTQTIYNMIKDGRLSSYKVGREWRFKRHEVLQLLQRQQPPQISLAARGVLSAKDLALVSVMIGNELEVKKEK